MKERLYTERERETETARDMEFLYISIYVMYITLLCAHNII